MPLLELRELQKQIFPDVSVRQFARHCDIISEGDRPNEVHLLSSGFACRYKLLRGGTRQIMGFLIPGDFCDLRALLLGRMDHAVGALGGCDVMIIPHPRLFEQMEKQPRVLYALWRETMLDAAICRQWLTNVGRRDAYARLAHLFCEVWYRLQAQGLAHDHAFDFRVTQSELADALGLSVVHVNRTIQQMRAEGLIGLQSHSVTLLDLLRLQEVAEFDPDYLQVSHVQQQQQRQPEGSDGK
jgi:CRP-like cAMP-binding protein